MTVGSVGSRLLAWQFMKPLATYFVFDEYIEIDTILMNVLALKFDGDSGSIINPKIIVEIRDPANRTDVDIYFGRVQELQISARARAMPINSCHRTETVRITFDPTEENSKGTYVFLGEIFFDGDTAAIPRFANGNGKYYLIVNRWLDASCLSNKPVSLF
jgi:hypothetical protein